MDTGVVPTITNQTVVYRDVVDAVTAAVDDLATLRDQHTSVSRRSRAAVQGMVQGPAHLPS